MTQPPLLPDPPTVGQRVVRCAHCRRPLHDPTSRAVGYGPACGHLDPTRRYDVEQDTLPGL